MPCPKIVTQSVLCRCNDRYKCICNHCPSHKGSRLIPIHPPQCNVAVQNQATSQPQLTPTILCWPSKSYSLLLNVGHLQKNPESYKLVSSLGVSIYIFHLSVLFLTGIGEKKTWLHPSDPASSKNLIFSTNGFVGGESLSL